MSVNFGDSAAETLLEVLKFLDYNELCCVQRTNCRFNEIIERYKHKLPLCKLHKIEIIPETKVTMFVYRRSVDVSETYENRYKREGRNIDEIYHIDLSDEKEQQWKNVLDQLIPSYAFYQKAESLLDDQPQVETYFIFITCHDGEVQRDLSLELPLYPATMEDLYYMRFWIDQLARVHFHYADYARTFFNPEFLDALFNQRPQFHSSQTWLRVGGMDEVYNKRMIQFAMGHMVTDYMNLRARNYCEGILDILEGAGAKIGKVVFPFGPGNSTVELQNLLIHYAQFSLDPYKMVGTIEFQNVDDFPWPDLGKFKPVEHTDSDGEDLSVTKYRIASRHFPDVHFWIEIGHFNGTEIFRQFTIQRQTIKQEPAIEMN